MLVPLDQVHRFSSLLAEVHASATMAELARVLEEVMAFADPPLTAEQAAVWRAALGAPATEGRPPASPDGGRDRPIDLLWCHLLDRTTHLSAAAAPVAPRDLIPIGPAWAALTPREREVAFALRQGRTDAEAAALLGIAARTVSKHVEHILAKTDTETRAAAVGALFGRQHF